MNIGERIKAKRKEKGISQKQLAETAGLSITAIQSYEYGKYKPKIEQVEAIAGALGITPYDLMGAAYWDENIDTERVSNEAATLDSVSKFFGKSPAKVLTDYLSLNATGQQKAADYIADLTEQPKYTK